MKILFIVPYAPSLIRVRPHNFLRALARQGHDLTLATLWCDDDERAVLEQLAEDGVRVLAHQLATGRTIWNSLCALPTRQPIQAHYAWHPGLAASIETELAAHPYDVVHVEHLRGARYGVHARKALDMAGRTTPVVWDSVDSISHLFSQASQRSRSAKGRLITKLELGRTRRSEEALPRIFDRVIVTSAIDRSAFVDLSEDPELISQRIAVVPNGVDTLYFRPDLAKAEAATLVITGKMSYHANVTMVLHLMESIMPKVWQHRPDVRVWIVGKDPPAAIRAHGAAMQNGTSFSEMPARVIITDTVPDIRPYLQQATLAVAPIAYGAGIQNKVLEAMACATPVVASRQAVAAINVADGHELAIAEDDDDFVARILNLLPDESSRRQLGVNGRNFVERCHSWDAIADQLVANYDIACHQLSSAGSLHRH